MTKLKKLEELNKETEEVAEETELKETKEGKEMAEKKEIEVKEEKLVEMDEPATPIEEKEEKEEKKEENKAREVKVEESGITKVPTVSKKELKKFIKDKTVFEGLIKTAVYKRDEEVGYADAYVEELNLLVRIPYNEFGNLDAKYLRITQILDRKIRFVLKEITKEGIVIGSAKERVIEKIKNSKNKILNGKIMYFIKYGAFIKINNEEIYGLLRNTSIKNDKDCFLRATDIFKVGDKVAVRIDEFNEEDLKIQFVLAEEIKVKQKYGKDYFKEGMVVQAKVKSITTVGVFVQLDVGIDAICSIPPELEGQVYENTEVYYKITDAENGRFSGRILNIVG